MISAWKTVDRVHLKSELRNQSNGTPGSVLAIIGGEFDGLNQAADVTEEFFSSQGFMVIRVLESAESFLDMKSLFICAWRKIEKPSTGMEIPVSTTRGRSMTLVQIIQTIKDIILSDSEKRFVFIFDVVDRYGKLYLEQLNNFVQLGKETRSSVVILSQESSQTNFRYPIVRYVLDDMRLEEVVLSLKTSEQFRGVPGHVMDPLLDEINQLSIEGSLIATDVYDQLQQRLGTSA